MDSTIRTFAHMWRSMLCHLFILTTFKSRNQYIQLRTYIQRLLTQFDIRISLLRAFLLNGHCIHANYTYIYLHIISHSYKYMYEWEYIYIYLVSPAVYAVIFQDWQYIFSQKWENLFSLVKNNSVNGWGKQHNVILCEYQMK